MPTVPITELCDEAGAPLILGVHPSLAVVSTPAPVRASACKALMSRSGLVSIDAAALEARVADEQAELDRGHLEAIEEQTARLHDAQDALRRAAAAVTDATEALNAAHADVATLDALEGELADAQRAHDEAAEAEADKLQRVSDVLRRRQRLAHHRRDAAAALTHLRSNGSDRGRAEVRQQVADIEAALSRAESEQAEVERQVERALTAARDRRLATVAALEEADTRIRAVVPASIAAAWPPGPPLPNCVADHRVRLVTAIHDAEARIVQAKEAHEAAGLYAQQQERELDRVIESRQSVDRAEAVGQWLSPDGPLATNARLLLIDEAFEGRDLDPARAALELLSVQSPVQIIYLTDNPEVLSWAIELPHVVGGISGLGPCAVAGLRPATAQPPAFAF